MHVGIEQGRCDDGSTAGSVERNEHSTKAPFVAVRAGRYSLPFLPCATPMVLSAHRILQGQFGFTRNPSLTVKQY